MNCPPALAPRGNLKGYEMLKTLMRTGGSDETRTRDLRRDRPQRNNLQTRSNIRKLAYFQHFQHFAGGQSGVNFGPFGTIFQSDYPPGCTPKQTGQNGQKVLGFCRDVVHIPTRFCMNLAATVNVVLYDRLMKTERRNLT